MSEERPENGAFYKHFKGNIYQVKAVACNSETGEEMVLYQAMYPPFGMWVRPLDKFTGEVGREKYPDIQQRKRFKKININEYVSQNKLSEDIVQDETVKKKDIVQECHEDIYEMTDKENINDDILKAVILSGQAERRLSGKITDREIAERGFMEILDAETYHEKYLLFKGLKNYLDERLLSNIAVALDIVLGDGDIESHYDSILSCLQTLEHYEGGRLR